jgi:hypothetical protein
MVPSAMRVIMAASKSELIGEASIDLLVCVEAA